VLLAVYGLILMCTPTWWAHPATGGLHLFRVFLLLPLAYSLCGVIYGLKQKQMEFVVNGGSAFIFACVFAAVSRFFQ
jgi:hypothetical protein